VTASIRPASAQRRKLPPLSPEKIHNLLNAERSHTVTIRLRDGKLDYQACLRQPNREHVAPAPGKTNRDGAAPTAGRPAHSEPGRCGDARSRSRAGAPGARLLGHPAPGVHRQTVKQAAYAHVDDRMITQR
jgi:hypothetical protein